MATIFLHRQVTFRLLFLSVFAQEGVRGGNRANGGRAGSVVVP